jgi:hypothetical protein
LLNGEGTCIALEHQEQRGNLWLINIIIYLQVKYKTYIPEFIVEMSKQYRKFSFGAMVLGIDKT